jgi:predicted TIM-barrel fold metal-dependent hydrolase
VFAELDRRAAVVFLHPPGLACASPLIQKSGLTWPLGAPVEEALCAIQLMQAGFPRRYPNMKIILPHLAGFLAHLRYRFDRSTTLLMPNQDPPSVQMRKFWYDSSNGEPASLAHAIQAFGIERILFGSDYPYWVDDDYQHGVDYISEAGLSDEQLRAVQFGNARTLLPHVAG